MNSSIVLKKKEGYSRGVFTAVDERFLVEARYYGGARVREWQVRDRKLNCERAYKTRAEVRAYIQNVLSRELPAAQMDAIKAEVKMMLHACRDTMRMRFHDRDRAHANPRPHDPTKVRFDTRIGDYGEAFGILRALRVLGYGDFGGINVKGTLSHLMAELEDEVLKEEGFEGDGKCAYCFERYRRDDARPRGETA